MVMDASYTPGIQHPTLPLTTQLLQTCAWPHDTNAKRSRGATSKGGNLQLMLEGTESPQSTGKSPPPKKIEFLGDAAAKCFVPKY